jgi:hypothetical protein
VAAHRDGRCDAARDVAREALAAVRHCHRLGAASVSAARLAGRLGARPPAWSPIVRMTEQ